MKSHSYNPLLIILASGLFMVSQSALFQNRLPGGVLLLGLGMPPTAPNAVASFSFWKLFLLFGKLGAIVFGSGYVLLAFLRSEFVEHRQWITETQLLDAVSVGQLTPGPVFTTATFIGYLLGGPPAALIATVGIFLDSFVLGPLLPSLQKSRATR